MTQEQIDEAIKNCRWLSQNRGLGNMIPGICSGECLPCTRVIASGKCEILIELFGKGKEQCKTTR